MTPSFVPAPVAPVENLSFVPWKFGASTTPATPAIPVKTTVEVPSHSAEKCAAPKVTLTHNGDVISSIHIECPCGQIIDLNCAY